MDAPTVTGAEPAGAQPQTLGNEPQDLESQAESLMDAIVKADDANFNADGKPREPAQAEGEQPAQPEKAEAVEPEKEGEAKPEAKAEDDGPEYASLDEYLADNKIDKESFLDLPVTVKVDGKDQTFPLKEIVDGFNLKTASYERMQEVAKERATFTSEQQQVRQALGVQIQRTEALLKSAQDMLMGDYGTVTQQQLNELRAKDPGQYAAFIADYRSRVEAIQNLTQQVDQARKEQALQAENQRKASLPGEIQKLLTAHPEWRDPVKHQAAQKLMNDYGVSRGFSVAELNAIFDSRYVNVLHDAAMYRQLKASEATTLKRVRSAPKMVKPGTRTTADPKASQYSQTRERALKNPDSRDAMEAWATQLANA